MQKKCALFRGNYTDYMYYERVDKSVNDIDWPLTVCRMCHEPCIHSIVPTSSHRTIHFVSCLRCKKNGITQLGIPDGTTCLVCEKHNNHESLFVTSNSTVHKRCLRCCKCDRSLLTCGRAVSAGLLFCRECFRKLWREDHVLVLLEDQPYFYPTWLDSDSDSDSDPREDLDGSGKVNDCLAENENRQ